MLGPAEGRVRSSMSSLERVASLVGHVDTCVWHVAWSPAGVLASCGTDKTIRLWVEGSGEWQGVAVLEEAHQRTIRCVAWSPCGSFLASCSFDGTAMVWEVQGTEFDCVASLEGHENEVKAVAWSRSGQYLATCGRDKSVWVWEGEDEQYEVAAVIHSHTQDVKSVAWRLPRVETVEPRVAEAHPPEPAALGSASGLDLTSTSPRTLTRHPQQDVLGSASYDDSLKLFAPHGDDWCRSAAHLCSPPLRPTSAAHLCSPPLQPASASAAAGIPRHRHSTQLAPYPHRTRTVSAPPPRLLQALRRHAACAHIDRLGPRLQRRWLRPRHVLRRPRRSAVARREPQWWRRWR